MARAPPVGVTSRIFAAVISRARSALAAAATAVGAAGAACLPPDPRPPSSAPGPEITELVHAWRVDAHLLARSTSLSDPDADHYRGRPVTVGQTGYTTPWQGTCEESGQTRRVRPLAEVAAELGIERSRVQGLGFTDPLAEHRLTCQDIERRTPALMLFISGARALTCYGGACYVLVR